MLAGQIDGVSEDEASALATLRAPAQAFLSERSTA